MNGLIGKKLGMTHLYDEDGRLVPVTVVDVGPNKVVGLRTREKNGYSAVCLGYGRRKLKNVSKALRTEIAKAGYTDYAPERIREVRLDEDAEIEIGAEVGTDLFNNGDFVDIAGITKGRGFQGVVKRHGFRGGGASHGSGWQRRSGSVGECEKPGRLMRGRKMSGQMGNVRRTVQNLKVVFVRPDENVILVKGAIPGPNGGLILVRKAKKKQAEVQQ